MPHLPPRRPPPAHWPLQVGPASGAGRRDFYALGYSQEYDEAFATTNPETYDSPTSRFTHVLHYVDEKIARVFRVPDWLMDVWWSTDSGSGYALGFPRGVFEFDAIGIRELIFDGHEGTFAALWGFSDAHLFACGFKPFAVRRHNGVWQRLVVPVPCTEHLHDVCGASATDVYFAGGEGTVLHFDGADLHALEIPTTRNLYSIARLSDTVFCIGGASGMLLMGNRRGFRVVASGVDDNLETLAHFNGCIYYVSQQGLHVFDGRNAPRLVIARPFDAIASLGDALLLQEGTDAWLYDGRSLTPLATTL